MDRLRDSNYEDTRDKNILDLVSLPRNLHGCDQCASERVIESSVH
jgi:hypothetical protein